MVYRNNFHAIRKNSNYGGLEYQLEPKIEHFASGIAEKKGAFKYGVKVSEIDNNEPIYDEDPYIEVY